MKPVVNVIIAGTKALLLALWLACLLSLTFVIPASFGQPILWTGAAILLVHLLEYLVVRSKVAERQNGKTGFFGTMVYGFGYWLPILRQPG